jgi:hypothetical protein
MIGHAGKIKDEMGKRRNCGFRYERKVHKFMKSRRGVHETQMLRAQNGCFQGE